MTSLHLPKDPNLLEIINMSGHCEESTELNPGELLISISNDTTDESNIGKNVIINLSTQLTELNNLIDESQGEIEFVILKAHCDTCNRGLNCGAR